jgi:type I restriction enzyme M protein
MPKTTDPELELEGAPPTTKPARGKREAPSLTTAQRLGSLVKSARDIMRKDKGLSGDTDRLPQLTWIMFLKFLDDLEKGREEEALLSEKPFRPILNAPYRWRDWADKESGPTGDDLIDFISAQELTLGKDESGNDKKAPGLFRYLRGFQGDANPHRAVVGNIFRNTQNRMADGYLLKNVVNLVDSIHFDSSEEIHTLGHMYETMLKEMRDAAGDSGEFYTPRPVVRFMVEALNPRLGETVYDPAAGTGGFLCEAFQHLEKQCRTVEDRETLQNRSILGGEAKALPYLLCQMNLLLHGVDSPNVALDNSLKVRLGEIGEKDRVDVIMTNPPFGGEEEPSIQSGFPQDKRTSETALLFLQLIMRKLRREGATGRAGVVVPNGTLFADGVAARVKEEMLKEFNLHTIVRLPLGVFAPYTNINTNILFFDRSGPTEEVWYYELPLPEGRKNYTKTAPIQYEEFAPPLNWWHTREESERAWRVPVADVLRYDDEGVLLSVNLDVKNPNAAEDFEHLSPEQLVRDILDKEQQILTLMTEIGQMLAGAAA